MGDLSAHGGEERLDHAEILVVAADHDAERAVDGGLPHPRHRRIDQRQSLLGELGGKIARALHRAGAHINDGVHAAAGRGDAARTKAHLGDFRDARQRQENDISALRHFGDGSHGLRAGLGDLRAGLGTAIGGDHGQSRFPRKIAAHRRAHDAKPDEPQCFNPFRHSVCFLQSHRGRLRPRKAGAGCGISSSSPAGIRFPIADGRPHCPGSW